ncbi:MAG: SDR family oxidoreductase [Bacteroidia bacterium]|nr:SDR family oxidoreductase [Bacteroidia bacterium]
MMKAFENKVIWITGASSGIGEELAFRFAAENALLVLSSRRFDELIRIREKCRMTEEQCMIIQLDMTDCQNFQDAVDQVIRQFGRIDILINNAGISQRALAIVTLPETERRIMEVNFFGVINLSRQVLKEMLKAGSGHIVVLSSMAGKFGFPLRSAYAASKHALHGYFETLRLEMKKENIVVTMVVPGRIKTNISLNSVTGNGSAYGIMDKGQINGIPVSRACIKIIKGIKNKKFEVIIARQEKILLLLKRFLPSLYFYLSGRISST